METKDRIIQKQDELIEAWKDELRSYMPLPWTIESKRTKRLESELIALRSELEKEQATDALCDPDIYEANANTEFEKEIRQMRIDNDLPLSGLD